ncbi:A-kinase anchor protein 17B-like isoform X1 [Ahaetulla prasina]|uniref:A-kinase anchor protein 17B-like isoform X1 n=1 Tax=Ahaetulla prasina TaxID=499056 RepID=UPI002647899A|nr:A-kinase anchor protein 17B-like isoform X1 [Ahaetulla prasina]XP_058052672.1 A-kinase anchor protein 17B-like isoform X1 [Ahaetulla prasina]XP_058052673.1 A-kinase anchor protein 17B-like isoform X1 [Ahaetulla prasina]XP_058052674.1 A-kinase anchor protein 17B-like isoform X1 [Ahaetulla prasina]XP_058052675.1 A-kinase anchor protein 17B-like isoform X1 [Ahaetulla prasina]XP_058052676.1 A-kinase anchor protein 17B-like isoform X1 [Ahaetulla prasina]XP_058052677.1 A-kinase anchor protein 17
MTVTLVCDPSEATELCAAQQLYLKPVAKLTISVVLPEHTGSTRAFSKWEVMDKLKNIISPDQLTSVKVSKSTKAFIRFEGEAETKRLVSSLKEKLHGQLIKLNGFKEDLRVVATEAPPDGPPAQESEPQAKTRKQLEEEEQSQVVPDCVYLEGLPCKWFAPKGSDSETPSEEVLRAVFGTFGEIKNIDIPMLDPYREEMVGRSRNHFVFRGMRSFEAFVQYQEPESFARAMEALKGMKLMFKGDDGKALACNIKVTSDATNHFSENAIKQRTLERLTLQGLERERKREENRGRKGTERKRREEEDKKGGEGRRRSKIKRREKRRIDREEKRPRKHLKATAAEGLNSPDLPEWEERKYILAQRRVESIRLLTVLLSQIKNFVLSSGQAEAHLPEPQPEEEKVSSPAPVEDTRKEETDVPHLEHPAAEDETQPAYPSALLENVTIEEEKEEQFLAGDSPPSFRKALSNEPAARAVTSHLTENVAHPFRAGGLLQVTVTQDCQAIESSPDRWAYLRPHLRSFADAPCVAKPKKQKVYETEEFIHYLLNYYQTPRYARICPSAQSPSDTSWWNRVVSCSGDGFRVKLKNRDEDCWTDESLGSDLPENEPREDDEGDPWEIIDGRSEPAEDQACPQEFSESYQGEWDDSLEEDSVGSPPDILRSPIPGGRNNISRPKTSQEQTTEMTALSSPTMYKLKDLLEEISSDSEYFSEALNETRNPSEQRNGGYQGSCKTWTLHHNQQKAKELLIRVQNVGCEGHDGRRNARSFCSGAECCDSPAMKPKTRFKRSGGKLWYEEPKIQWLSSEEERDLSRKKKKKKRKRFSDSSFPDEEAQFLETNHRRELEAFSEIQRKCSKLIHRKAKCKTLRPLEGTFEIKDLIHFSASPSQEEAQQMTTGKGNLDVGERRHKADDRQRLSRRLVER